jgi:hypothetical protein
MVATRVGLAHIDDGTEGEASRLGVRSSGTVHGVLANAPRTVPVEVAFGEIMKTHALV